MGEYAIRKLDGEQVKIGTCENMYYLRFDQRDLVRALPGNVNVNGAEVSELRFRFPWPDEDSTARPGLDNNQHDYDRSLGVSMPEGFQLPDVEHGSIQLSRDLGGGTLLASIPCPLGPGPHAVKTARNGWNRGDVLLYQQALRPAGTDGALVLAGIGGCAYCGSKFWMPRDLAESVAVALRADADRKTNGRAGEWVFWHTEGHRTFLHTVADRLLAGYEMTFQPKPKAVPA